MHTQGTMHTKENDAMGAIVDNRIEAKMRVVEGEDRNTIKASRDMFFDFFRGTTRITAVVRVSCK